jgi:hypothetical protein
VFLYGSVLGSAAAPAGDYNENGVVDAADYTVWRDTLGSTVTAFSGADGDGDGNVDQEDYNVWKADFGAGDGPSGPSTLVRGFVRYVTSGAGTAVPEPSSVLLIGVGFALLAAGGRRKTNEG